MSSNGFYHIDIGKNQTVNNENLKLLKNKISSFMNVRILGKKRKKNYKKMSPSEIKKLTDHFRKRVAEIERKKEYAKQLALQRSKGNNAHKYHLRSKIEFPFLTYMDDKYSSFMTLILRSLEVRKYMPDEIIAEELEEC